MYLFRFVCPGAIPSAWKDALKNQRRQNIFIESINVYMKWWTVKPKVETRSFRSSFLVGLYLMEQDQNIIRSQTERLEYGCYMLILFCVSPNSGSFFLNYSSCSCQRLGRPAPDEYIGLLFNILLRSSLFFLYFLGDWRKTHYLCKELSL